MYEVHIQCRGPEGLRGCTQFRLTQKGSDELADRIAKKAPMAGILDGLELETEDAAPKSASNATANRRNKS